MVCVFLLPWASEALNVELPRFRTVVKAIIDHEQLTNNDIDSLNLQVYDIFPNVKSLVTFLRTSFVFLFFLVVF